MNWRGGRNERKVFIYQKLVQGKLLATFFEGCE
jgi:hypothetical protein